VFARAQEGTPDVDEDLYGGFIGNGDRRRLNELRAMLPAQLAHSHPAFDDPRLPELLFRYRARNFPDSLTGKESAHWEAQRAERFYDGLDGARTVEQLFDAIDHLSESADERGEAILGDLYDYVESIAPARA